MPRPVPILKGEIVTLRPIDPERDAQDYYDMCLEPEMHLWTGNRVLASQEEAQAELQQLVEKDMVTAWAIVDNASGRMIGRFIIVLEQREDGRIAGEGNRIAKPYWRKGHNSEARQLVFQYVFNALKTDRIETECWTQNENSRLSILAHGFTLVREDTKYNKKYDMEMPMSHFVLTREEWLASIARA